MEDLTAKAEEYRQLAVNTRGEAEQVQDPELRKHMLELCKAYDEMCEHYLAMAAHKARRLQ